MAMYNIPTEGSNLEIMGFPFFIENVSPGEAFRRREYNFNGIVGGTQKVTPGAYVGLDFNVTTHVPIDPDRPDMHNTIFQEMMSKQVEILSPDLGGRFNAIVVIKPERDKLDFLKLTISIKEVPDTKSLIPGEEFTIPAQRVVEEKEASSTNSAAKKSTSSGFVTNNQSNAGDKKALLSLAQSRGLTSKINSVAKKNKGSE